MIRKLAVLLIGIGYIPSLWADNLSVYQLPQLEVSAKPPISYTQSPQLGNQIIISASQIERSGVTNLSELLSNTAGVQYVAGIGSAPQILIHSEPAMIMIDGQALTNFSMSNPDIGLISLSEIKEIVITPGVAGAEYGNQSLGGVINIITWPAAKFERHLTLIMGLPFTSQENLTVAGPMSSQNSYRIYVQNEYDQGYRASNQQSTNQAGLKLQHLTQDNSFDINFYGLNQNIHYPGYLTNIQAAQDPSQSIAIQGQGDEQSNTGMAVLDWRQNISPSWQSQTHLSFRQQAAQSNLDGLFDQDYQTITLNPELQGTFYRANHDIQAKVGFMLSNETYSFTSPTLYSNINDANQQQYSGYGSLVLPIIKKLSLSASGRLVGIDTHAQFFNDAAYQFNPPSSQSQNIGLVSLSLNNQFTAHTEGYLRRAMGYQLPFIDESSYTASPNTGFGLKATTSTAYETGINWHNKQWQTNAELFLINLNNEIGYYTPPDGLTANYNLAPTRREGVTFDAGYQPTLKWTLHLSSTVMNNRFREGAYSGNVIPGASQTLESFSARYQLTKIWSAYGETQYVGSQYAEGDNANISASIPSYWLFNFALNAEFSAWVLNFRIDNVLDTRYNLATIYDPDMTSLPNNNIAYYPAPGRTAMLSITYRLS
ncbi:MAG: btuB [Gammaproteobacteria bacterium]|nr:btuB [Gammaproteobacteria bacterium]